MKEERKAAKKSGTELPRVLVQKTSPQCSREGLNYSLQCLDCALEGARSIYWGESGVSPRQRHELHQADVDKGEVSNSMVMHSLEVHGGKRPNFLSLINRIKPRPLYRAVCEAIQIAKMPAGPENINHCQEWGTPRVPILTVTGGDMPITVPGHNPRQDWTQRMLDQINKRNMQAYQILG